MFSICLLTILPNLRTFGLFGRHTAHTILILSWVETKASTFSSHMLGHIMYLNQFPSKKPQKWIISIAETFSFYGMKWSYLPLRLSTIAQCQRTSNREPERKIQKISHFAAIGKLFKQNTRCSHISVCRFVVSSVDKHCYHYFDTGFHNYLMNGYQRYTKNWNARMFFEQPAA